MGDRITALEVADYLTYEPETGYLYWRFSPGGPVAGGSVAGSVTKKGYRIVRLSQRPYRAHALAWALSHGRWPDGEIDHINGDKDDNRIVNLRDSTRKQNMANRGASKRSRTGARGVRPTVAGTFIVQISHDARTICLGTYPTKEEAAAAYIGASIALHGNYAFAMRPGAND